MGKRHKVPKRKQTQVTIPKLTRPAVITRATRAFDIAVNQTFSKPPPASELKKLGKIFRVFKSSKEDFFYEDIIKKFVNENPSSVIARYFQVSGQGADWLFGRRGIKFNKQKIQSYAREYFTEYKKQVVKIAAQLHDPKKRSNELSMVQIEFKIPGVPKELRKHLHEQFTGPKSKNRIALDVKYVPKSSDKGARLVFNNLQPPPTTYIDAGEEEYGG